MNAMMIKSVIVSLVALNVFYSCGKFPENHYDLHIKNHSEADIYYYFNYGGDAIIYPDTLMSFDKSKLISIKSGKYFKTSRSLVTIAEWVSSLPKDTLSIFFLSCDTLNTYPWEKIQQDYNVLRRYDLGVENIEALTDERGIVIIPYPPTEIMKSMKMYPPYESN